MQVIQPTFDAYHSPVLSTDIFDPAANIYVGMAYAIHAIVVKAGRKYVGY